MTKENIIQSSLNQTAEEKAKNKKLRESQIRAEKRKLDKRKKDKVNIGRESNGDFAAGNKLAEGNGRPPIYDTPEELTAIVDEYFDTGCRQITLGLNKDGEEIKIKRYTITGLCLYLGFSSKQSLYEYGKKDGFIDPIKKARLRVEEQYEEMLASKHTTGAIFALKNMDWKDKTEIEHDVKTPPQVNIIVKNK